MSALSYAPASYGGYEFPGYAQALGWLMSLSPVAVIIVIMIAQIIRKGVGQINIDTKCFFFSDQDYFDVYGIYYITIFI